ncbi:hypothetical protein CI238_08314 [Colletotrichum incanum]|uniref:Uncharacterized protein n=1 Tax=Colletotrichum incanum TaxID=1573173 RepID=A0A167AXR6_COLIC|nr:hypothetical protein CI238_08314 [Colletotrichum incanum]
MAALRTGSADCVDPNTVHYPKKPKWFPPEIPITTILEADELYTQAPNEEELRAWDQLMPLGRGLVMLDNETALPEMPNLDQSLPRGATAWIGIAHQLHCLYSTKHAFYDLYYNQDNHNASREKLFGADWNLEHLNHCWDYLRQGLMCNTDLTLEWRGKEEGTGWGYQRQCKDWNAIYHWIENHRLTNDRGILRDKTKAHPLDTSKVPGVWGSVYGPSNPPP